VLGWQSNALPTILSTVYVQNAWLLLLSVSGKDAPPLKPAQPVDMPDIYAGKLMA